VQVVEMRPALTPARVWWLAARPATLAASVAPVLVGTAVAVHEGGARLGAGLAALVVAIAMQLGVNYANDYFDFVRGADTPRRRGPVRAAASGLVPPRQVRRAALAAFGVAAAVGLGLSLATDWRLLGVGALAVLAGWLYTGGPRPYGYLGLGELFVFVFFGLVATAGTTYVESGHLGAAAWLGGVATGSLACAILVLNNLRDIETDAVAGKRTLAVRLGASRTRVMLALLLTAAFAAPIVAFGLGAAGRLAGLALLAVPLAGQVYRLSASDDPKVLVAALKRCAELEVWFALLWTVGLLAS
jgi:1,4-dihydroxy-2-naphthoate octaprenyltransferase